MMISRAALFSSFLLFVGCQAPGEGVTPPPAQPPKAPAQEEAPRSAPALEPVSSAPASAEEAEAQSLPGEPKETLSPADLRPALRALEPEVIACFRVDAQWIVPVRFTLEPSGRVSGAAVTDELAGTPIGDCIAAKVKAASFPSFRGRALRVSYPFVLGPIVEAADVAEVPLPEAPAPASAPAPAAPSGPAEALIAAERSLALNDLSAAEEALAPYKGMSPPAEVAYLLGTIAARRGQIGQMCSYYKQYLALAPSSPAVPGVKRQLSAAAGADPACAP